MSVFRILSRAVASSKHSCILPIRRRHFSVVSIHSSFPASLYRFQLQRHSTLYDVKKGSDDGEVEDGVEVCEDDGLVYPGVGDTSMSLPTLSSSGPTKV